MFLRLSTSFRQSSTADPYERWLTDVHLVPCPILHPNYLGPWSAWPAVDRLCLLKAESVCTFTDRVLGLCGWWLRQSSLGVLGSRNGDRRKCGWMGGQTLMKAALQFPPPLWLGKSHGEGVTCWWGTNHQPSPGFGLFVTKFYGFTIGRPKRVGKQIQQKTKILFHSTADESCADVHPQHATLLGKLQCLCQK